MKNQLFYGDNLDVLRKYIKDESIDLCYIDPPFNSKRNYNQIYLNQGQEDKAQAQAFIDTWNWGDRANDEIQELFENKHGLYTKQTVQLIEGLEKVLTKGSLLAYLVSMTLRITEIHRALKDTGSFYLHCDPTSSHYLKLICDSIFCGTGRKGEFLNEIIWHYRRWTGKANKFQELHDIVFYYSKTDKYTFNVQYTPYTEGSKERKIQGVLHRFKKGEEPYLVSDGEVDEKGVRENDVWQIPFIAPSAIERLGYPTQKPERLLEKMILASTNINDIVLDAFCGCGTTVAVAQNYKRKWIGIDITYQSISLILKRLSDAFTKVVLNDIEINGIPKDFESAVALANKVDDRTRKEFEKWAVLTYTDNRGMINEKKGKDGGIDGVALIADTNDKEDNELMPIIFSVKSDKNPHVSYVRDLIGTMTKEKAVMGFMLLLYEPTRDMIAEARQAGKYKNTLFNLEFDKVKIVTVPEILRGDTFSIPQMPKVLKEAKRKADKTGQNKLDM